MSKGIQAFDVLALRGDRALYQMLLSEAFTNDLLDRIEKEDPGRTEYYMKVMDFIVSAAYALTQLNCEVGILLGDTLLKEMRLEPSEQTLLLGMMERFGLITADEGGIRIERRALETISPPTLEKLNG